MTTYDLDPRSCDLSTLTIDESRATLVAACRRWRRQLGKSDIGASVRAGRETRAVAVGWLVERYHQVKAFPYAVQLAVPRAQPKLRRVLGEYARQERGHEQFLLETLERLGLTAEDVEHSLPLVSTRSIDHRLRDLFLHEPSSVLVVAAVLAPDPQAVELEQATMNAAYGFSDEVLAPLDEHMRLDAELGHATLLERHLELVSFGDGAHAHTVIHKLRELERAFRVQSLEIRERYGGAGLAVVDRGPS